MCLLFVTFAGAAQQHIELPASALEQHPNIVYQGLLQSLMKQDLPGVELFLPVYQRLDNADPAFIHWAQAVRAWHTGKYSAAIKYYRDLIARYPNHEVIRLQLAMALFDNQDNEAAEQQFERLRSGNLPPLLAQVIDSYLARIRARDFWSFNTLLSWSRENNINNAPPPGTRLRGWQPARAESASGFVYGLRAYKSWSHRHGLFSEYRFDGDGKRFWDNSKYDELTVRNSVGLGYRDNNVLLLALPFFEQRWYGGGATGKGGLHRYTVTSGLRLESRYRLSAHWLVYTDGEYGVNRYQDKKYLNGQEYQVNSTLIYYPSPGQFWFAGINYQQLTARDGDDSYHRYGVRAGWNYDWPYGVSSRLQVGYARRNYQGKDFFGILQRNNEYNGMITLWHRGLYFWGITPKISWLYQKTQSNHPFYRFDKHKIFWNLSKDF